ncbi:DUF3619 family protein [Propionivibrio limicola]|uniref:DUF3619 family protein n=1 Tax=Propionivibrio limicola TaxID=167645 RepID=UPI001478683C|nr:DUF3619 family protein [Propionivibrio limicola]
MNELHFAYKIRQQLNRGAHELPQDISQRLAAAREHALACQKVSVHQQIFATAGGFGRLHSNFSAAKQTAIAVVFLLIAVLSTFLIADRRVSELGDIDSALLADELPVSAFTDKGFAAWLEQSSQE